MLTVVMVVEGVLRLPQSEAMLVTGKGLFAALAPTTRLYLLSYAWTESELQSWLARNQLTGHLGIITASGPTPQQRLDALRRIRSWRVELVIEPDPQCAALEIAEGWTALLHAPALYAEPAWRPDHTGHIRPWQALTDEMQHQENLRLRENRARTTPE
ncbi:hypothetical protein [Streptomyces sp. CBMA29]|uniref:hypothetical protein n=1 Tax=Streptomyces sp. CBMA29 TaxID=1896314 RepID=UPI0016621A42|nr:hypothetical protein [Streptomyces sp. CBMA29]MBD0734112.1 hypothetical protein [Streptomyces sp. CBMA29]